MALSFPFQNLIIGQTLYKSTDRHHRHHEPYIYSAWSQIIHISARSEISPISHQRGGCAASVHAVESVKSKIVQRQVITSRVCIAELWIVYS